MVTNLIKNKSSLTVNKFLIRINQIFTLPLFFLFFISFNEFKIISFIFLLTFTFIKRIDIIYCLLFFNINYTFSYILLSLNPDEYMFTSMASMGHNLDIVFMFLNFIMLIIIFILYIIPVRGSENNVENKSVFQLLKFSIFFTTLPSLLGIYGVGKAVSNFLIGYLIRIAIVVQTLTPLIFSEKFKKYKMFLVSLLIIGGIAAGSRAFLFSIFLFLLSYALVKKIELNLRLIIITVFSLFVALYTYPIISANRLGQEFSYTQPINESTITTILNVRQRFGGVDIANGLYNSGFKFPWYQLFGEMSIALNKYIPGDIIPTPSNFYPSEYISAKLLSGYDFLSNKSDDLRYTESMRLGRFFIIDPFSIIILFSFFIFSLFIQNRSKELNYYIRFSLIYNMLMSGAYSESFYYFFDMILLNMIIIFFHNYEIKLSSRHLFVVKKIKYNYF